MLRVPRSQLAVPAPAAEAASVRWPRLPAAEARLSALEGHGRDELLHLVGQALLPGLLLLLQGRCDLCTKQSPVLEAHRRAVREQR